MQLTNKRDENEDFKYYYIIITLYFILLLYILYIIISYTYSTYQ